jgi:hypothetical protein
MTNVISTEGGALCRRSGEIPVFRLLPLLFPLSLYFAPVVAVVRFTSSF